MFCNVLGTGHPLDIRLSSIQLNNNSFHSLSSCQAKQTANIRPRPHHSSDQMKNTLFDSDYTTNCWLIVWLELLTTIPESEVWQIRKFIKSERNNKFILFRDILSNFQLESAANFDTSSQSVSDLLISYVQEGWR